MKIIIKIAFVFCVLVSSQSYAQQASTAQQVTTSTYNFNTGAIRNHSGFTLTLAKQGLSTAFDPTYGLKRHFDLNKLTDGYKPHVLSDTFVDTSFLYKKEIPGTTSHHSRARPGATNLESFIITGLVNTIFN